jgi:hypothetical protein
MTEPSRLTDEAKAELRAAIKIIREDYNEKRTRGLLEEYLGKPGSKTEGITKEGDNPEESPKEDVGTESDDIKPPPVKSAEPKPVKKGLYWG